jgi:hypothetical protein
VRRIPCMHAISHFQSALHLDGKVHVVYARRRRGSFKSGMYMHGDGLQALGATQRRSSYSTVCHLQSIGCILVFARLLDVVIGRLNEVRTLFRLAASRRRE